MIKEMTLNELGEMLEHVVNHMATKEDLADLRSELKADIADVRSAMATTQQLFILQSQVNSIEGQLRDMNHGKLEVRVGDLEEKVFGAVR